MAGRECVSGRVEGRSEGERQPCNGLYAKSRAKSLWLRSVYERVDEMWNAGARCVAADDSR